MVWGKTVLGWCKMGAAWAGPWSTGPGLTFVWHYLGVARSGGAPSSAVQPTLAWSRGRYASPSGLELLVIDGSFEEGGEHFTKQSWLRLPKGSGLSAVAGANGARVWMKRGHLAGEVTAPQTSITDPSKA